MMREDMFNVLVERPRLGPRYRHHRVSGRPLDGLPSFEGIGRTNGRDHRSKRLNENLAPLRRYLQKQVGRPWSKIYGEICQALDTRSAVKQHVRDHLEDFVAVRLAIAPDGELTAPHYRRWLWRTERWWPQPYYVDPRTGLLCNSAKLWRKKGLDHKRPKRGRQPSDADRIPLSDDEELRRIKGIWYRVRVESDPVDDMSGVWRGAAYGGFLHRDRRPSWKRQLSKSELAAHGLSNTDPHP